VVSTPLKKNDFVSWDDDIPNIWKAIKFMFQTTNQVLFLLLIHIVSDRHPPQHPFIIGTTSGQLQGARDDTEFNFMVHEPSEIIEVSSAKSFLDDAKLGRVGKDWDRSKGAGD